MRRVLKFAIVDSVRYFIRIILCSLDRLHDSEGNKQKGKLEKNLRYAVADSIQEFIASSNTNQRRPDVML